MNGYVGVLDLNDIDKTYVKKRKFEGPIRTEQAQEEYILNKRDSDRILYGLNADNEKRPSRLVPRLDQETGIEELGIEDPDKILRLN